MYGPVRVVKFESVGHQDGAAKADSTNRGVLLQNLHGGPTMRLKRGKPMEAKLSEPRHYYPCGVGVPGWPRLMSIPCAAAYLSRTTGFVEARLRAGDIPFHIKDADERVIDRLDLDDWIARQHKQTGKLRHPVAATEARRAA
jgi:hypothetical protein